MAKLHEILAVDRDKEVVASKLIEGLADTFKNKKEHFTGHNKRLEMFNEERKNEQDAGKEVKEITTTVASELKWLQDSIIDHFDVIAQKDRTNQTANANIVLSDGTVLAENLPATLLLTLESKLAKIRTLYEAIPTLQPGIKWVLDPDKGENYYKAEENEVKLKTEKLPQGKIIAPATERQPAQIIQWTEDKGIGKYITERWSSAITPADKSKLLEKIDTLIAAVKKARSRANEAEVVSIKVGKVLMDYINS
jgi:hypothetical protein